MKLSIIIINYNTPNLVYDCVKSVVKHLRNVSYEIIVVDNGSQEELRIRNDELGKILPAFNFQLLTLKTNLGFGAGNNAGAKKAKGDILWFLNSDTLLVDDSIKRLFEFLDQNKNVGIASPIVYNDVECRNIQPFFFAKFQSLGNLIIRRNRPKTNFSENEYFETDVVVGASLITRKEIFNKLGGFDENIFMFFEDDDLCFRAKKMGYRVAVYCQSQIVHLQGKSISKNSSRKKLYYTSQTYFWKKHYGLLPTLIMRIIRWPYKLIKARI